MGWFEDYEADGCFRATGIYCLCGRPAKISVTYTDQNPLCILLICSYVATEPQPRCGFMCWFHQVPNDARYQHILAAGAVLPHLPPSSIFDYLSSHHDLYREHPFFKSRLSFTADPDINLATFNIFESHVGANIDSLGAEELRDWTERITSLALFLRKKTANAFDRHQRFLAALLVSSNAS
ncbi:hypothetical protein JCM10296v2_002798 [Rhodotorula toruloides]